MCEKAKEKKVVCILGDAEHPAKILFQLLFKPQAALLTLGLLHSGLGGRMRGAVDMCTIAPHHRDCLPLNFVGRSVFKGDATTTL